MGVCTACVDVRLVFALRLILGTLEAQAYVHSLSNKHCSLNGHLPRLLSPVSVSNGPLHFNGLSCTHPATMGEFDF